MITQFGTKCYQFWYADVPYQYHVFSFMVLIASLVTFWPFFAGYHDTILELSVMRNSVQSIENIVASTVVITLAVPLIIDGILDFALSLLMDRNKAKETADVLNYVERTFIYSGFLSLPICAFVSQQYTDLGLLTFCCSRFQYFMVYGGCFMCVSRIAPHCFPKRLCLLALGAYYSAHFILTCAYLNIGYGTVSFHFFLSNFLLFFTFAIFITMLMHWMWLNYLSPFFTQRSSSAMAMIHQRLTSSDQINILDDASILKNGITKRNNMFVSLLTVLGVISTIIMLTVTAAYVDYTPTNFVVIHIAFSLCALGLLIYHLRKFRSDAMLRLHALVNKKAILLTYVHELYEPISTIYKAQKHMMEDLGQVITIKRSNI